MPQLSRRGTAAIAALLLACATLLVWTHTPRGTAISMDSLTYLSTARNIALGQGISFDTHALGGPERQATTVWPPLYPALLSIFFAIGEPVGLHIAPALRWLNALLLFASLLLLARIVRSNAGAAGTVLLCLVYATLPSTQVVYTYAWSETLFIPITLLAYLLLRRHLDAEAADRSPRALAGAVLLLALACYVRYVGLAFFVAAMGCVLIADHRPLRRRALTTIWAGLLFALALLPLLARNLYYSGALSGGDRGSPAFHPGSDLSTLGWRLYLDTFNLPPAAVAIAAAVAVLYLVVLTLRARRAGPAHTGTAPARDLYMPLIFAVSYFGFLLVSRTLQTIDLDTRMISVAMPFMLLAIHGGYRMIAARSGNLWAAPPFLLWALAALLNGFGVHSRIIENWRAQGAPGTLLGIEYPSVSDHRFDALRRIRSHFAPGTGDLVLTDISRPLIPAYLFPGSDVRQLPADPSVALDRVEPFLHRTGLVILTTSAWTRAMTDRYGGQAHFYSIVLPDGNAGLLVMKLPVN